jgi:hypothetical protein
MKISQRYQYIIRFVLSGFCWLGFIFVAYGTIASMTGEHWRPLEVIADPLSSALTIIGTAVTAGSIFFFDPKSDPPEPISYATVPLGLLACAIALAFLFAKGLSVIVVNGFAIMGLGGALLRIHPNPSIVSAKDK